MTTAASVDAIGSKGSATGNGDDPRHQAPYDLQALGVEQPFLAWERTRAYMRLQRAAAKRAIRHDLIEVLGLQRVRSTWITRRGVFSPDRNDVLEASAWLRAQFRED